MANPPPRRVLIPLGLGTALSLLGDSTLYTVLAEPSIAAVFNLSLGGIGLVLGVNRLVRLGFNSLAGGLFDRLPRKPLLLGSMLLGVVANASYGVAHGLESLLLGRVLWGAAWSGLWVGAHTMIMDISHDHTRGRLSGRYQMWFFAGVAATALAGGGLTDALGVRPTLWAGAGSCLVALVLWWFTLPETLPTEPVPERARPVRPRPPFAWRSVLAAGLPYFTLRVTSAGVLASTTILWLGRFFQEDSGRIGGLVLPLATATGVVVAGRTVVGIGGAPAAGWLSDRLQRRWPVLAAALLIGALGLVLMAEGALPVALAGAMLIALAGPGIQALSPAILGDRIAADKMGRALGGLFTFGDLGSALGPLLAFALLTRWPLGTVYLGCAALVAATGIFALGQSRRRQAP